MLQLDVVPAGNAGADFAGVVAAGGSSGTTRRRRSMCCCWPAVVTGGVSCWNSAWCSPTATAPRWLRLAAPPDAARRAGGRHRRCLDGAAIELDTGAGLAAAAGGSPGSTWRSSSSRCCPPAARSPASKALRSRALLAKISPRRPADGPPTSVGTPVLSAAAVRRCWTRRAAPRRRPHLQPRAQRTGCCRRVGRSRSFRGQASACRRTHRPCRRNRPSRAP